ncbi:hypothetical protein TRFO_33209 [Tritrichomonas foetus]|uniref:IPT/TIG domain-containing protein n=1 Tax=Tritrichomonas foetus TaxID=1144522 RepID=A0A1J4JRM9_9EUKA|nr:hypothetical protein TRFO_33209 [Tritrichomonas foetus]|eukprot:OHT00180.1 hypothetical protein TRFO_33209 [Tritrichomonas foetus]
MNSRGDEKVEILLNTTLDGPAFIKFGNKIVTGRHSKKDLVLKVYTPRLPEGEIPVYVSMDKVKWCEPMMVIVIINDGDLPWIFVGCAGLSIIVVSLIVSKLICGKRAVPKRKKPSKKFNDDPFGFIAPSIRSNEIHKRTKFTPDL